MGKRHSLQDYVYRVLGVRIFLMACVLSAVLTVIIFAQKREQISDAVRETAHIRIQMLITQADAHIKSAPNIDPRDALKEALDIYRNVPIKTDLGHFVFSRVYDDQGQQIQQTMDPEFEYLETVTDFVTPVMDKQPRGRMEQELVKLDGRPYVHLVYHMGQLPTGEHFYIEAMFSISEDARSAMRTDLLESILWEVGIIMLTSLLLYPVILKLTRRLSDFSEDLLDANMDMLQTLGSAIAKRDSDTSAHNFRVTIMAVRIAESMKLSHHDMQRMIKGAFLHDVGKIGISDTILLKPGKLTDEEFDIMKTHVNHGVDILTHREGLTGARDGKAQRDTSRWIDDARDVVSGHHEKFNGSGYPNGAEGLDIPRTARIFAIADVFDALTCRRPYKEPFSYERSMAIITEGRGSHFDPDVVDAFVPLSEAIYKEISGREDEGLRDALKDITAKYFQAGLQSLKV